MSITPNLRQFRASCIILRGLACATRHRRHMLQRVQTQVHMHFGFRQSGPARVAAALTISHKPQFFKGTTMPYILP